MTDRIRTITGVYDVIPTKKVSETGKFYVLVDKQSENGVRDSLKKRFDKWYHDAVPEDAKPQVGRFEGPPEIGNPRSDGFSSGENSWITASTKSFMTFKKNQLYFTYCQQRVSPQDKFPNRVLSERHANHMPPRPCRSSVRHDGARTVTRRTPRRTQYQNCNTGSDDSRIMQTGPTLDKPFSSP